MKKVRDKAKVFKVIDTQNNIVLFEGNVREVAKKLGITKNNVYSYTNKKLRYRKRYQIVSNGVYRRRFGLYRKGELEFEGTFDEICKKYFVEKDSVSRCALDGNKLLCTYVVKEIYD